MNARIARKLRKLYPHADSRHRDYLVDRNGTIICAEVNRRLYQQAKATYSRRIAGIVTQEAPRNV